MRKKQKIPDWLIGLMVTLFFLYITSTGVIGLMDDIEMKSFDLRARITAPKERNPHIELVVITDDDLSGLGRFPWPRHILAQAIQNLALAGAKVIALNIPFAGPEKSPGLKAIKSLRESYEMSGLNRKGAGLDFYKKLSKAAADLDNDSKLYRSLKKAGNVVLPVLFNNKGRDQQVPDFISKHSFKQIKRFDQEPDIPSLISFSKLEPIMPSFAEVAAGIGHMNLFPDQDGYIRDQVNVVGYLQDTCFPSFPLAIVKLFKGLKDQDITVILGEGIDLKLSPSSIIKVPADSQMRTLIHWSSGPDVAFHQTPFTKVLKNNVQTSLFRDKIVIIGPTAPILGDRFPTPVSGNLPAIEIVANSVVDILSQSFFSRPQWVPHMELAILVFFGLFITFIFPRLRTGTGLVAMLGLLIAYSTIGTVLFFYSNIWLRIAPPILLLIVGCILIVAKRIWIIDKTRRKVREKGVPKFGDDEESVFSGDIDPALGGTDTRFNLGRYEIVGEIGQGPMGVVYRAFDLEFDRSVAIKTVKLSEFDQDIVGDIIDRFFREVESVRLLSHPNIVNIYDCGEANNLFYIVTEYLEGNGLEQYTKKGHLFPIRETLSIIGRVADALGYAHSKNVVHQDIKPSNIIRVKGTNEVKVTDFGIVQTPSYMSPEQVSGKKVDGRSDIFSLGIVLFEMLTGEKPFTGDDMTSLMLRIAKGKHPSPRNINPRIPGIIEKIIDKALEKDLDRRYQRADQMSIHLKKVVAKIDEIMAKKTAKLSP
jgi:CHASE2 domain-containing sensor protein